MFSSSANDSIGCHRHDPASGQWPAGWRKEGALLTRSGHRLTYSNASFVAEVQSKCELPLNAAVARASLLDWNPLIFHESGSRFIVGLAPNQWTFSRSMSGPTSYPDGAVSRCSARWFYGLRRLLSANELRSRSTHEMRKTDAWIAFLRAVHP
jgi:hypothetical protein